MAAIQTVLKTDLEAIRSLVKTAIDDFTQSLNACGWAADWARLDDEGKVNSLDSDVERALDPRNLRMLISEVYELAWEKIRLKMCHNLTISLFDLLTALQLLMEQARSATGDDQE